MLSKQVEYSVKWADFDSSHNSWVDEEGMNCVELLLEYRVENGHGRRIIAAHIANGDIKYLMQWGDGSHSSLLSCDVTRHWSRLLLDFLLAKTTWRMPVEPHGSDGLSAGDSGDSLTPRAPVNVVGNAIRVLCKYG